jgi:hypothetical protein
MGGSPSGFVASTLFPGHKAFEYSTQTNSTQTNSTYALVGLRTTNGTYTSVPDLQFSSNINFTVAMWIQLPIGYVGNDLPFFTDAINSTENFGYAFAPTFDEVNVLYPNEYSSPWPGGWAYSLYGSSGSGVVFYGNPGGINDGNWHHLAFVFDRQLGETTYVDGVSSTQDPLDINAYPILFAGTTAAAAGDIDNGNPSTIGQDPTGAYPEPGQATINDLGVWNRALAPLEVGAIFTAAASNSFSFTGGAAVGTFTFSRTSTNTLLLSWSQGGVLQTSTNLSLANAGFINVTSNSPYITGLTNKAAYFRVKF